MPQQLLKNSLNQLIEDLNNLDESSLIYNSFDINCNDLPTLEKEECIYKHDLYKEVFDNLEDNKRLPYVYWFEIKNDITCTEIRGTISKYATSVKEEKKAKIKKNKRRFYCVPFLSKKAKNKNSKILYVGKVKSDLRKRLKQHLGYHGSSPDTQGLQLLGWANNMNLKLKFHYIQLPHELEDLTSLLEFRLAKQIKPILGKNRG